MIAISLSYLDKLKGFRSNFQSIYPLGHKRLSWPNEGDELEAMAKLPRPLGCTHHKLHGMLRQGTIEILWFISIQDIERLFELDVAKSWDTEL